MRSAADPRIPLNFIFPRQFPTLGYRYITIDVTICLMSDDTFPQVGLLAETLLEASAQDNAVTGAEITRLREETRAKKRKLAQARRERALKAMNVGTTTAVSVSGASVRGNNVFDFYFYRCGTGFCCTVHVASILITRDAAVTMLKMITFVLRQPKDLKRIVHISLS